MEELKKGDIVQLKSGGPKMTIYDIIRDAVSCTWFNKEDNQEYAKFSKETIQKFE